ncbi:MAG TPA: DegV family protein, partial [Thermoanaerobaculia bacterium]
MVPALDEVQGSRFAAELAPGVVVAPARYLPADGERPPLLASPDPAQPRTVLLLAEEDGEVQGVPEDLLVLAVRGLSGAELVPRVHLVLLGREIGVEPDEELAELVGDLTLLPLLDLLRALHRAGVTGRVAVGAAREGEIALEAGEVVAAAHGKARGKKAFCRLAALEAGAFHVRVDPPGSEPRPAAERETFGDLTSLIIEALEDRVHDAPDPRTRVRVEFVSNFFELRFPDRQQEILSALPAHDTVGSLLDALQATDGQIVRDLLALAEVGVVVLSEPEAPVRVVTDSTCDLPPETARAHGIHVVPLLVLFDKQIYHDGVDLKPRQFYERLATGKVHPHSNPPLKGDFLDTYRALGARKDLVSVHLSEKLSQTIVHARAAARESLPALASQRGGAERPAALEVVDSGSVSLGLGLLALFAARMAARGM